MAQTKIRMSTAWAMPSRWTFQIPPIADFISRWLKPSFFSCDPFCGTSTLASIRNDLGMGGKKAEEWLSTLPDSSVDLVFFDPPYSPRQISECYKSVGLQARMEDTQNGKLYSSTRKQLDRILIPGGVALSFGWQSSGFGKKYVTHEILLVQHGGAHNDTICVAQTKGGV